MLHIAVKLSCGSSYILEHFQILCHYNLNLKHVYLFFLLLCDR